MQIYSSILFLLIFLEPEIMPVEETALVTIAPESKHQTALKGIHYNCPLCSFILHYCRFCKCEM